MPPLPGFSDSPLETRSQVVAAAQAFLKPLPAYTSQGCSRVRIPVNSGTLYDETAAQLEGFSRPLWVTGSLLMCGQCSEEETTRFITGLTNGLNPEHPEYWGDITDIDQRMVETETLSFTLLGTHRHLLWDRLSSETRSNLARWYLQLNGKQLPRVNWLWFRVFTNIVLVKICQIDTPEVLNQMKEDLDELDTFYLGNGWSSDGLWRGAGLDDKEFELFQETGKVHSIKPDRCVDFYSGSFALQFCQLLYIRFAGDLDPERTEKYRQQAREFGAQYWTYFDENGAVIPFGRSLIYRFASAAFFAALALAKVPDMPAPLNSPGAIKGFLLRHLRWWAKNSSDIFRTDGTMNFGWLYPNMYLTEDYNSPQSVFWTLKSFIAIGLLEDDAFWKEAEVAYPKLDSASGVKYMDGPRQIVCNRRGSHHFLLSSAQFTSLQWTGGPAKYCKFAYSSSFGFSVPTGAATLQQLAPDNALLLSRDGTQTWATKWKCRQASNRSCQIRGKVTEQVPFMTVVWYPWEDRSVEVFTVLVAPFERWPDWHVRVHRIKILDDKISGIHLAEGGFAIHGRKTDNMPLPAAKDSWQDSETVGASEFTLEKDDAALISSSAGTTGLATTLSTPKESATKVSAFQPEANTNLMTPRTLMPLAEHHVKNLKAGDEIFLTSKVFAVPVRAALNENDGTDARNRWSDCPIVKTTEEGRPDGVEYIDLSAIF